MKILLLVPLLLLTGCSAGAEDSLATDAGPASTLSVEVDRGDGTPAETWTLDCSAPGEGSHPEADAACAALQEQDDPFAPLPADMACTEQYGGPQQARVTGTWSGSPVDLTVLRRNGCEISQWESLVPLVPAAS